MLRAKEEGVACLLRHWGLDATVRPVFPEMPTTGSQLSDAVDPCCTKTPASMRLSRTGLAHWGASRACGLFKPDSDWILVWTRVVPKPLVGFLCCVSSMCFYAYMHEKLLFFFQSLVLAPLFCHSEPVVGELWELWLWHSTFSSSNGGWWKYCWDLSHRQKLHLAKNQKQDTK